MYKINDLSLFMEKKFMILIFISINWFLILFQFLSTNTSTNEYIYNVFLRLVHFSPIK